MFNKTNIKIESKALFIVSSILTIVLGLFINFFIYSSNTYAATTANIKTDFGAVGDGIADDTTAILDAFASSYDEVFFPEGDYLYTQQLTFGSGDKTILGENATLFTNDAYRTVGLEYQNEWAIRISSRDNITFNGMKFETRQVNIDPIFKTIIGIMYSENIHFDNCEFHSPSYIPDKAMNPVDFFADWQNVSVKNSRSIMHNANYTSDNESGGTFMFRNFSTSSDCENIEFTNNIIEKNNHDEMFWIGVIYEDTTINNVVITGNKFYVSEPKTPENTLVHTIAFSAPGSGLITNVDFYDNEIIGRGRGRLFSIEGLEDAYFYDNDIYAKIDSGGASSVVESTNASTRGNTPGTVEFFNNRTIAVDSPYDNLDYLTNGSNPFSFHNNKNIIINAVSVGALINNAGGFSDNNIVIYGNVTGGGGVTSSRANDVQNNEVTINGFANAIFHYYGSPESPPTLSSDYTIANNNIITTEKRDSSGSSLISMQNFIMDGKTVTIKNNTVINGYDIEMNEPPLYTWASAGSNIVTDNTSGSPTNNLWFLNISDSVPADQEFIFCNNNVKGFQNRGGNKSSTITLTCS